MTIPTESFEAIFEQYSEAISWMKSIGVKISNGKTLYYEKIIGYWKAAYKKASIEEGEKIFPDFVSSMFEIGDFVDIHKAFKSVSTHQLTLIAEKLQKAVNGPTNATDETSDSTTARNFLFEVTVAAKANRPDKSITTILDAQSDTGIGIDGKKVWVECKRISVSKKIEKNVRDASNQLENLLKKQVGSGHRGIVALDVSRIINPENKLFIGKNDRTLVDSVKQEMDQFLESYSEEWNNIYSKRNRKIIGTLVRFAFMSRSDDRGILVRVSQWGISPRIEISNSDHGILKRLETSLW